MVVFSSSFREMAWQCVESQSEEKKDILIDLLKDQSIRE